MHSQEDRYTNLRIGTLTILRIDYYDPKTNEPYWLAQCDCGRFTILADSKIKLYSDDSPRRSKKDVISCACCTSYTQQGDTDGGRREDRRYMVWYDMLQAHRHGREYNAYIDSAWNKCENFIIWCEIMYEWTDPTVQYLLFQYDTEKGYTPENCYLVLKPDGVTAKSVVRRKFYQIGNESYGFLDWCKLYDVSPTTVWKYMQCQMSFEEALEKAKQIRLQCERKKRSREEVLIQEAYFQQLTELQKRSKIAKRARRAHLAKWDREQQEAKKPVLPPPTPTTTFKVKIKGKRQTPNKTKSRQAVTMCVRMPNLLK